MGQECTSLETEIVNFGLYTQKISKEGFCHLSSSQATVLQLD